MRRNHQAGKEGDFDRGAYEQLMRQYRPLVYSVCRRFLRQAEDVEDAAQETFVKLGHYLQQIDGSVVAWLSSAAYTSSIDLIRRNNGERRRINHLAWQGQAGKGGNELICEPVQLQLQQAMLLLDARDRFLVAERFFRRTPLRVIAQREGISMATLSRRVTEAIKALGAIYRDLGYASIGDLTIAEYLDASADMVDETGGGGLRFAADWKSPILSPHGFHRPGMEVPCLSGWTRPIRVGMFVSYASLKVLDKRGMYMQAEEQVLTTSLLVHPGIQLVGVVEPDTDQEGPIERVLRDYELTGGLIDGTDIEALKTLDVIILGVNYVLAPRIAAAFNAAVHDGTGLLNEWWTDVRQDVVDENIRDLMLAASPVHRYHMATFCGDQLIATVVRQHHVLRGASVGTSFLTNGCGPMYRARPDAEVLITKDLVLSESEHTLTGLGPAQMPVYVVGKLGLGRVVAANFGHNQLPRMLPVGSDYLINLLSWLAEPRREGVMRERAS